MPTKKTNAGKTPANKQKANDQKGAKVCPCCHQSKKMTDYYISRSPLYSLDERVPVCKECMINNSLNEDGTINELELNKILRQADKPYFKDDLAAAAEQFSKEHSYIDDEDVTKFGKEILQLYFKNIGVIEITMLYCQTKKVTEAMNLELQKADIDDAKVSKLTSSKTSLLSSIATIAKDNNIASNYNKNSKQGQSSLASKMKEMSDNGFAEIEVNLFDIKTSEAFRQIDEISNNNIANQLTLDTNDYTDIVREQREILQRQEKDIEQLREENRLLKNQIIDLESKKR